MKDRISLRVYGPDGTEVQHYVGIGAAGFHGNSLWAKIDGKRYQIAGIAVAHIIPETTHRLERHMRNYSKKFVLYGNEGEELLNLSDVCATIPYGHQSCWQVELDNENGSYYLITGGTALVTDPGVDELTAAMGEWAPAIET
jgi:hypothetical protein